MVSMFAKDCYKHILNLFNILRKKSSKYIYIKLCSKCIRYTINVREKKEVKVNENRNKKPMKKIVYNFHKKLQGIECNKCTNSHKI